VAVAPCRAPLSHGDEAGRKTTYSGAAQEGDPHPRSHWPCSGISRRAVCFLTSFNHTGDVGLHIVYCFLGASRQSLAR
jgi:hypothetical protein